MTQQNIGLVQELTRELRRAYEEIVEIIRSAVRSVPSAAEGSDGDLPLWRTPAPWERKVLPNLERTIHEIDSALERCSAGDAMGSRRVAEASRGLAKNLDNFSFGWADAEAQRRLREGVARTVEIAGRILGARHGSGG
jgi:hypothetical protein